jgi:hypothetical protein
LVFTAIKPAGLMEHPATIPAPKASNTINNLFCTEAPLFMVDLVYVNAVPLPPRLLIGEGKNPHLYLAHYSTLRLFCQGLILRPIMTDLILS